MSRRGRTFDLGLAALATAQLGAAAWLTNAGDQVAFANGTPIGGLCLFRSVVDVECPFCGMTRSFVALAHGHLGAALTFHPAGPLLFAAMVLLVGAVIVNTVRRGQPLVERRTFLVVFESVVVVCLAIGIFKMVRS